MPANPFINMVVGKLLDLIVYENDAADFWVDVLQSDNVTPIDISTWVPKMQVRKALGDPDPALLTFDLSSGFSLITSPIVGGSVVCRLNFIGEIPLAGQKFVYDLQITVAGRRRTYLYGNVKSTQDVTV